MHINRTTTQTLIFLALVFMLVFSVAGVYAAETPKRGGILTFVVPDDPPSYDGHRERTYGLIHPIAPFYSTLIRVNPKNPASPDDFVCDLCTEMPKPTEDAKKYTFKLRKTASFWDGQPVTAHDVMATFNKIIFPPPDVRSPRKAFYSMVQRLYAPDDYTVVFELKYPTSAFIPALASPWNFTPREFSTRIFIGSKRISWARGPSYSCNTNLEL